MDLDSLFAMLCAARSPSEAASVQTDFFRMFYANAALRELPAVKAFMIVSGWLGTSFRSGVWTFYEATPQQDILAAVHYLQENGSDDLAAMLQKGCHDYQAHQDDFEYPEAWISESEEIDSWIQVHEDAVLQHLTDELLRHRQDISAAAPSSFP